MGVDDPREFDLTLSYCLMCILVLQLQSNETSAGCACCGANLEPIDGPCLSRADTLQAVCIACGRKYDPRLAALLELAGVAQRVGQIGRHSVSPPLTALLDLARAAENYTFALTTSSG